MQVIKPCYGNRRVPATLGCILLGWIGITRADVSTLTVAVGRPDTSPGKLMMEEVQTYFGQLFSNTLQVVEHTEDPAVALGTPTSNLLIRQAIQQGRLILPRGKNADQGYAIKTLNQTIYVAASTETGLLYGLYALLEEYGAYFQMSGDCLPERTSFQVKELNICVAPLFKYRGVLPWDNFLCGSSGYNPEDWQVFLRNATRMRFNKLDLHFYPGNAQYNEVWDGQPTAPKWAMDRQAFMATGKPGAKAFRTTPLFAVRAWQDHLGKPLQQAEACQATLRDAIDLAHRWGWVVVAGFALCEPTNAPQTVWVEQPNGDNWPNLLAEQNIANAVARYRRLVELYPNCDYYWMWQSEGGGVRWSDATQSPDVVAWRKRHDKWGDPQRIGDRDYAGMFLRVAERLAPEERARLATGGWDIQHLFPGIDADFPRDIILASLHNAYPSSAVPQLSDYRVSRGGRRTWMIAWWEFDGNQWFPQFRLGAHEQSYRRAVDFGVEGVSLLGWKWSGVEHHQRYLADFAWGSGISAEEFIKRFVGRVYGPDVVDEMAALYGRYEAWEQKTPAASPGDYRRMLLGAGWCNLALPEIPATAGDLKTPKWRNAVAAAKDLLVQQAKLQADDLASVATIEQLMPRMTECGRSWARLLANRLAFRARYVDATLAMNRAFIAYDQVAQTGDLRAAMQSARKESATAVSSAAAAIEIYADDCRNRGDLGVVAQLNYQFYDVLRRLDSTFQLSSPYQTLDDASRRCVARIRIDMEQPWGSRDGTTRVQVMTVDGNPVQRIELGGGTEFNSVWILRKPVRLDQAPILDFSFRTTSAQPIRLLFQVPGDETWYGIDLIGTQAVGIVLDRVKSIHHVNDGQWHRVTWNLRRMITEEISPELTSINNLIIGTWVSSPAPAIIELRRVAFGVDHDLNANEK